MARSKGDLVCHTHDSLVSFEVHHVWPQEYHGPNTKKNLVKICCNAHSDIHDLMNKMLRGKPYNLVEYGPNIRALALRGYNDIMAYAASLATAIEKETA
jgi:hypothetical protein